ncbi:Myristoyl-CoA:protein N-myristoyltransferase domain protein [Necator americanus]|uniref:Glycylpeptide N-tetradecanoyltransferase n=1 Tax=Necator americanus TaxID=51031 RepID=W2TP56_NECAM|nr:Myristoyl-CoA:protein N-myristoyltransferase domain protein [Necator americanus]ETN83870.1 Myristoyl-CoA:protein N-myristoyltransferase domain protein [Necator americanus]
MSGKKQHGGHGHSHGGDDKCCDHNHAGDAHGEGSSEQNSFPSGADMQQMVKLAEQLQRVGFDMSQLDGGAAKLQEAKSTPLLVASLARIFSLGPALLKRIRHEPYSLPESFVWSDVDLNDEKQLQELYTLLTENYVEDDDNMFRFDYSAAFLKWAVHMPGWLPQWHCGVRAKQSGRLLAFIAAVPQTIRVYGKERPMVEINFLCVHKKLRHANSVKFRSKRVAPVLIREITRRVNQQKIFQAVYTAGVVIPKPVGVCRYWHRSLNPKKLIDVRFSHLSAKMTMARTIKLYKLPDNPATAGLRPLEKKDIPSAWKLLSEYLKQFSLAPVFTKKEFEHIFMPIEDVVYTYVVEAGGKVTDMLSFYSLPSSVMHHPVHKSIRAVYSFYNVATTVPFKQLMNDALIFAHKLGFDVFNALDLMENASILEELKFGIGDGNLQYYLYNWRCPDMKPQQIGLVLQ